MKTKEATCICDTKMKLLAVKDCYASSSRVNCDKCGETIHERGFVYHCPLGHHPAHEYGYDICTECAASEWDPSYASGTCYIT